MVLLLRKLYLYFTKDPEGVHYFPGWGPPTLENNGPLSGSPTGVSNFFQGGSKC